MRLLIVGALDGYVATAGKIALSKGAKIAHVNNIEAALIALRSGQGADLVMIDVALNVKELVQSLERERIFVSIVACGIKNDTEAAVKAIKAGAKEYVPLPPDPELIAAVLQAVCNEASTLLFQDEKMKVQIKLAEKLAPSDASILITGESGTGKEVMARYIHNHSKRADQKLVSLNCAAIPDNLLESELFGHEKGAFTGAIAKRIGKFEEASGGTLFLDEISEMNPRLQAKLLRAIQEKEIDRVGGTKPIKVNIRIIATSNRHLEEEVKKGSFREDLYFRLNVLAIHLPPLRDRPKDIFLLANHFVQKFSGENGLPVLPVSLEAEKALEIYAWPGNVRELENILHRAVLLSQGEKYILPEHLQLNIRREDSSKTPISDLQASEDFSGEVLVGRKVSDVEKELILNTLEHCLWNRTHAATILGISIRTLRNKLKLYSDEGTQIPQGKEGMIKDQRMSG